MYRNRDESESHPPDDVSTRDSVAEKPSRRATRQSGSRTLSPASHKSRKYGLDNLKHHRPPVQPLTDPNTYQVIELGNGLKATLVSQHSPSQQAILPLDNASNNLGDDDGGDRDASDTFYMDHLSVRSDESDEEAPHEDLSFPRMPSSVPQLMAACSLTVSVGSFSDPPEIPGLSHFLEHMMMRGSLKYPRPMELDFYLHKVGGNFNSFTECEYTTYYFDCPFKHMRRALDIFAHCFVHPLLKIDYIAKARQEIEAETEYDKKIDKYRMQRILCALANSNNPAHSFSISCQHCNQISDDFLHRSLHKFRNTHYSSDRMCLAIQAPLVAEDLQKWVVDCFQQVPQFPESAIKFPVLREPFLGEKFYNLVYVPSERGSTRLVVTWALPPVASFRKTKPLKFIGYLFNYAGENSLLNHLKNKKYATDLEVESKPDGIMTNKIYSLFSVTITLTELGSTEYPSVLAALFCFVSSIKHQGVTEELLTDFQALNRIEFDYSENLPPVKNVEIISENMTHRSPREYLTDGDLSSSYQGKRIVKFLSLMEPNRANIMIFAHSHDEGNVLNQEETSLNTRYLIQDVPEPWKDAWMNIEPSSEFTFPDINQFIPNDFSKISHNTSAQPTRIKSSELMELWYKEDTQFAKPAACINLKIITSKTHGSVHDVIHLSAFLFALNNVLINALSPAHLAQYETELALTGSGLEIQVHGFSQHIGKVVQVIAKEIDNLTDSLTDDIVATVKTQLNESLRKRLRSVSTAARDLRMSVLIEKHVPFIDQLNSVQSITLSSLVEFSENVFSDVFIQALVEGNLEKDEALSICDQFVQNTKCTPLSKNRLPFNRVIKLPAQSQKCVCIKSFNTRSKKSLASVYFQLGPNDVKESVLIRFALMLMEESMFGKLRMEDRLGHDVSYTVEDTLGVLGFTINIHTSTQKLNENDISHRVTLFLNRFLDGVMALPQNDFYDAQLEMAQLISAKPSSLKEDTARNWKEITRMEYAFRRSDAELAALYSQNHQSLHMFLQKYVVKNRLGYRKLIVLIDGHEKSLEEGLDSSVSLVNSKFESESLSLAHFRPAKALSLSDNCYIENINAFKQRTEKYEMSKIVRGD